MPIGRPRTSLLGKKFGHLTVIAELPSRSSNGGSRWVCRCDCKKTIQPVRYHALVSGVRTDCGKGHGKKRPKTGLPDDGSDLEIGEPLPPTSKRQNLQGQKFGRWTVLGPSTSPKGQFNWIVQCDCGRRKDIPASRLIQGTSQSCGCFRADLVRSSHSYEPAEEKHLENSGSNPVYGIWLGIKTRCFNENHPTYQAYGAKGITMHPGWRWNFREFSRYLGPRPSRSHTVDRIDGTKGYEPGNVRWATRFEQSDNTTSNPVIDYKGEPTRLRDVAAIEDIPSPLLHQYITAYQFPVQQAIDKCRDIMTRNEDAFTDEDIKALRTAPNLAARRSSFVDYTGWRTDGYTVVAYLGRPTRTGKGQWLMQHDETKKRKVYESHLLKYTAYPPPFPDENEGPDWV